VGFEQQKPGPFLDLSIAALEWCNGMFHGRAVKIVTYEFTFKVDVRLLRFGEAVGIGIPEYKWLATPTHELMNTDDGLVGDS
jgi:hypothetical protein